MKAGETYVVDDGSALYLSTGNAGGIELVTAGMTSSQLARLVKLCGICRWRKTGCANASSTIISTSTWRGVVSLWRMGKMPVRVSIVWFLHQKIAIVAGALAANRVYQAMG